MFRRLLLDPVAVAGGGAPAPAAAPTPTPTPAATPPPAPTMVPLTVEEYQRLRSLEPQIAELRAAKDAELAAAEAARIKALADKGQVDLALEETRKSLEAKLHESTTRYADLERQTFAERKSAVIASAFAGVAFAGDTPEEQAETASQVRQLLGDRFETVRDASGALLVRDKTTGRPAADVIRESLAAKSFARFLAPRGNGGSGGLGSSTQSAPASEQPKPGSLEHLAAEYKTRMGKYQSFGLSTVAR